MVLAATAGQLPRPRHRPCRMAKLLAAILLVSTFLTSHAIRLPRASLSTPRRTRHRSAEKDDSQKLPLNIRGGADGDENEPPAGVEDVPSLPAAAASNIGKDKKWSFFKQQPKETAATNHSSGKNEGYVEFTMNSDSANIEISGLQKEINETLAKLGEMQTRVQDGTIKEKLGNEGGLASVANGGAANEMKKQHVSSKFPIARDELPHFISMSVLMFLFIYVFTTGEYPFDQTKNDCWLLELSLKRLFCSTICLFRYMNIKIRSTRHKRHSSSIQLRRRSHPIPKTLRSHAIRHLIHPALFQGSQCTVQKWTLLLHSNSILCVLWGVCLDSVSESG